MLSKNFSPFIQANRTGLTKLIGNAQNVANIRAVSYHSHTVTFSRIRPSSTGQNSYSPINLQVTHAQRAIHTGRTGLISKTLSNLFASLFSTSKEMQQKIAQAQYIKQENEEVYVDECKIKERADGEIKLYTTGLVYCTGILMIGSEKVGMAHIHGQGIEFMKNMFDTIQPHKLIIYASNGVSEHSSCTNFYASMMGNLNALKKYAKQSRTQCEITDFEYSTKMTSQGPGLFFHCNHGEKEQFFTLDSKEMKKLNQS